uniref:PolyA_pol_RNAbd domain-containing protein n=2 Tax=Caenorhabditis japonica TaxID=281687 RepID=A0A8R1IDF1_CAEJA
MRDIEARRVAFVGNARQRIQEDYLRILRYFRFFGRIANSPEHEDDTLQAIIENREGLSGVSAERIWTELKKIVVGRMASDVVKTMLDCGLAKYLGLPENCNIERFQKVSDHYGKNIESITLLACLFENAAQVAEFHRKTKLSNGERELAEFIVQHRDDAVQNLANDDWWADKIMDLEIKPGHHTEFRKMRARVVELSKAVVAGGARIEYIKNYSVKQFPVNGEWKIVVNTLNCYVFELAN